MISNNKTLDKVYTAKNHQELMDAYKEWASQYDGDLVGRFGYVAHLETAEALEAALPNRDAVILDAGCGTGLVGEALLRLGYKTVDALDYSREMLDQAEQKGVYRKVRQADLSQPLDIDKHCYNAVVCAGTFTYGHVKADALDELIRITLPGGIICFTIRDGAFEDYGYADRMAQLSNNGSWEELNVKDADYLKNEMVSCKLFTYRVL